ncbi:unnamed protein product [Bursaphelenchus okinawaensis]|uniref:Transmembrane protein 208 n=1 Tax=Bursaphelenchus okinawaensis TaxID=465554 RepID=A0A811JTT2_9BILA|nr:unnamed protein product [Bursaphelenchus okinawaensis]CAG9082763.1 unnamed protein product [Bursaphelenchus okinawaensis]
MNYNPNFEQIGNALIQIYYSKFDVGDGATRAAGLQDLYDPEGSIMTFEGTQVRGRQAILEKFSSLPFNNIQRAVTKVDCQPLADGSVAISVFGQLKTDEDPVNSFTQFFVLKPNGESFFIANEIFRLMKSTKQATRGQELIHLENQETLLYYSLASVITALASALVYYFVYESSWKIWTGICLSIVGQFAAILFMRSGVRCIKGPRGQIIDAGVDLNDPNALGEYCKDIVILTVICQALSLITSYFLLLLLSFPIYGAYKLWVLVIAPWIFAEPPEEDPMDDKRNRRRQNKQVVYRR